MGAEAGEPPPPESARGPHSSTRPAPGEPKTKLNSSLGPAGRSQHMCYSKTRCNTHTSCRVVRQHRGAAASGSNPNTRTNHNRHSMYPHTHILTIPPPEVCTNQGFAPQLPYRWTLNPDPSTPKPPPHPLLSPSSPPFTVCASLIILRPFAA